MLRLFDRAIDLDIGQQQCDCMSGSKIYVVSEYLNVLFVCFTDPICQAIVVEFPVIRGIYTTANFLQAV